MLSNAVAVTAGKGGVMKTTLSCHLAGLAASAGWRTLLVDTDPQGNAMFDLGYESDGGENLASALIGGTRVNPLAGVRRGLDVVCGGPALDECRRIDDTPETWCRLDAALVPLATSYDLIVIDSPARELLLRHMIMTSARFLVIPAGVDRASRVGLPDAARSIRDVRRVTNPNLEVLAVVAGPIAAAGSQIQARARAHLGDLIGDPSLVCNTVVRHSALVAEQCREYGMLSTEYAISGETSPIHSPRNTQPRERVSTAAQGVAEDWRRLVAEVLGRFLSATERPDAGSDPLPPTLKPAS